MRKLLLIVPILVLFGLAKPAMAQDDTSKAEAYVGYSYVRVSVSNGPGAGTSSFNFNGGVGQLEYNVNNWLGIVADFGGYENSKGPGVNVVSYTFGPRINLRHGKITPFAQALFGGARVSTSIVNAGSENAFATILGGGVDYNVSRHFAIRPVEAEYFLTKFKDGNNNRQNNFRYSAGIVFRF
ncbi:MAG: outer membrane beta-barrel protein [Candidatus Acidiferrales bacterium]